MTFVILEIKEGMTDDEIRDLALSKVGDDKGLVSICRSCGLCWFRLVGPIWKPDVVDKCKSCQGEDLRGVEKLI